MSDNLDMTPHLTLTPEADAAAPAAPAAPETPAAPKKVRRVGRVAFALKSDRSHVVL